MAGAPVPLDPADEPTAAALVDLQRRACAVEAALIGYGGIPQLTETVDEPRVARSRSDRAASSPASSPRRCTARAGR